MSDQAVTTNRIAMAADGTVYHCTPGGMAPLGAVGPGVMYGDTLVLRLGEQMPAGFWEVLSGSMVAGTPGGVTIRRLLVGG